MSSVDLMQDNMIPPLSVLKIQELLGAIPLGTETMLEALRACLPPPVNTHPGSGPQCTSLLTLSDCSKIYKFIHISYCNEYLWWIKCAQMYILKCWLENLLKVNTDLNTQQPLQQVLQTGRL